MKTWTRRCVVGLVGSGCLAAGMRSAGATPVTYAEPVVATPAGRLRGKQLEYHAEFLGIPFAAPPKGDLRWVAPQPVEPWGGEVRDVLSFGSRCWQPQFSMDSGMLGDEDCLYLNVYVPGTVDATRQLPVLVYIHGGGNIIGAGSDYDPHRWAVEQEIVVVTINYRLGILGTFGMRDLEDSGTFGFLDQIAALQWVRDAIEGFGGDPGNVTIAGQSWGGLSVSSLLVSPLARGLFHRAIVQSGVLFANAGVGSPQVEIVDDRLHWITQDEKVGGLEDLLEELQIRDSPLTLPVLRALPAEVLIPFSLAYIPYAWGTAAMPTEPRDATRAGDFAPVPVISGGTRDEARSYATLVGNELPDGLTEGSYPHLIRAAYGDLADEVEAEYPLDRYDTPANAWAAIQTDREWSLPTMAQHRAYQQHTPVWAYEFRDREAPRGLALDMGAATNGARHSAELVYLMDMGERIELSESQEGLARTMRTYWSNFARTGDPNGEGVPEWAAFDGGDMVQGLDDEPDGIGSVDFSEEHRLAFWEAVLPIEGTPVP